MKVKVDVQATRDKDTPERNYATRLVTARVTVSIDDAGRGDAVVGSLNAALDHGRKIVVETIRSAS